ncbi:MAG: hypothetical protein ABIT38_08170 [Gemmatimonadaceae bacterium]
MFTLVRRFLKTGIAFLAIGLGIGLWMVVRRELWGAAPDTYVVSAHAHAILVGFVMSMILGVALWLFPRPGSDDTRYRPTLAEWAYWLLALGTAGRVTGELLRPLFHAMLLRWLIVACSVSQVAGIGLFFQTMWSRIRPVGSQQREAKGERF